MRNPSRTSRSVVLILLLTIAALQPLTAFDQQDALDELAAAHESLVSGASVELSAELIDFLYANRETFPVLPSEASVEERLGVLIPPYSQLANLSNAMLKARSMKMDPATARISAVLGRLNVRVVPLSLEFIAGFDPDDPTYQTRVQGINQALVGVCNMYLGYLLVLFVEDTSAQVNEILLPDLREFGPELMRVLPDEFRSQVLAFMTDRIRPEVRPEMAELYEDILSGYAE